MTAERSGRLHRGGGDRGPRALRAVLCCTLWLVAGAGVARGACPPLPPSASPSRALAEAAYRRAQTPAGLYELAVWACQEGDRAAFADLLRRYADQTPHPSPAEQQQIRASWSARAAGVDMTVVAGRMGDVLVADGRLLAVLPLTQPLWLSAGTHGLWIERGGRRRAEISCPLDARKRYYVLQEDHGGLSCSNPLTVLLLAAGSQAEPLTRAAQQALRRDLLPLTTREVGEAEVPCSEDGCALTLARSADLNFLLTLREREGRVAVALWDVALRDVGGSWTLDCAGCTAAALGRRLQQELPDWVVVATSRSRGELAVASPPAGATVLLDGQVRGVTPLRGRVYAGERVVQVTKAGYRPLEQKINVPPEGLAQIEAPLEPVAASIAATRPPRPGWRLWTGVAALVGGATLVGFGTWGLAIAGDRFMDVCPTAPTRQCTFERDSEPIGIGLTAAGAVLVVGGALLLMLPAGRQASPRR